MRNSYTYTRPVVVSVWSSVRGSAVFNYARSVPPQKYGFAMFVDEEHDGASRLRVFYYASHEEMVRSYRSMLVCLRSWLGEVQCDFESDWHKEWTADE